MPIGNIANKVSAGDRDRLDKIRNPPEFKEGFGDDEGLGMFDDEDEDDSFFSDDDLSDFNASLSSGSENGSMFGSSGFGSSGFGSSGFGSSGFGSSGFGSLNLSGINGTGDSAPIQEAKPGITDKLIEQVCTVSSTGAPRLLSLMGQILKSTATRTADDWGYYGKRLIDNSIIIGCTGIVLWLLLGVFLGLHFFRVVGIPLNLISSAIVCAGTGFVVIGLSAMSIDKMYKSGKLPEIAELPDISMSIIKDEQPDYEDEITGLVADYEEDYDSIFSDDGEDDFFSDAEEDSDAWDIDGDSIDSDGLFDSEDDSDESTSDECQGIDYDKLVDSVVSNAVSNTAVLTRSTILDAVKGMFVKNTPGFADRTEIEPGTEEFANIESLAIEALASASRGDAEELAKTCAMHSCYETYFTYELRMDRIKGLNKLEDIEREMVAYFRSSVKDDSVTCSVDLDGKMYSIQISKGESAVVTYGDLFSLKEVKDFFYDMDNKIPMIAGISESGEPIMVDAKAYDTMLIAGKPRSGKSWYVLNIMMNMMFNPPEDIQFLIIDPKESNLFKTMALMPHVCGLHNDDNILRILGELIDKEGARRKKLLADNRCENVWDLKKKGINIPILYIVIDEVMTVIANLGANDKEFKDLIRVIVTQLPSQGIRLIMVPHRSMGVVEKSVRSNISFTAAIRAEAEIIKETLDIKNFDKPLINPGDTALKMQGFAKEMFVHGPAVTASDTDNTKFIQAVARIFYKMGIELPDMESIGCGYNRDLEFIIDELQLSGDCNRVQIDINDIEDVKWERLEDEQE